MNEKKEKIGAADQKKEARNDESGYMHQVSLLLEKFPELKGKTIPEEVVRAAMGGKTLVEAYEEYLAEQSLAYFAEEGADRTEKKDRRTADNAPVRGVSGGSAVAAKGEDDFLRGFNADYRTH